ncbi:TIGR04211 family SH3 domain-containing protein [Pseudoalteromonas xiamenensis]|uniref:TIGR04211 family SH3 domain-containing protein n=1 Tax=Pseudoalteromonas xiamenensis TaxID=882626 RepID=A0A975DFE0_9GAMM|nr:TIGR04211 family SH3 domain-containing protein [Pseudoalteromonas xiamenensis]QTH70813.1 TIGR04211 family SH3 domain-containing protein [Pseudoalteromonas xiamenensis]
MNTRTLLLSCMLALPTLSFAQTELTEAPATTEQAEQPPSESTSIVPNAYITDNLYIFVHSGAGKNYRILGSINAGTAVQVVGDERNGFVNVIDDKGREGWVEAEFVTTEAGLQITNQNLQAQLDALNVELQDSQNEVPTLQAKLNSLESENAELRQAVKDAETQKVQIQKEAMNKKQEQQHLLLSYGAAIAFSGLILGVLLTLFLSRRKRYDGWA